MVRRARAPQPASQRSEGSALAGSARPTAGAGPAAVATALFAVADGRLQFGDQAWLDLAAAAGAAPHDPGAMFPSLAWPELLMSATVVPQVQRAVPLAVPLGGTARWSDLHLVPDRSAGAGEPCAVLVRACDATQSVLDGRDAEAAEEALAEANARLQLAQEAAGVGTWEWDIAADRLAWSPEQFRLHGLDPAAGVPPGFDRWLGMVHPDDRPRLTAALDPAAAGLGSRYEAEFRLRRADTGEERWLLSFGRVMAIDAAGRPSRLLGVNMDVTERRRAEEARREAAAALAASEARFRGIFDSVFQFIGLLSPDGTLLEANHAALEFGGLAAADVVGRPFWDARWWAEAPDPATPRRLREAVAEAAAGAFVRYEVEVRGEGERTAVIDFSLRPVRDEASGAVVLIVPEGRDIGTHLAEEAARRAAEERFRLAQDAADLGIWEYDLRSRASWLSPGYLSLYGLPAQASGTLDLEGWLAVVHPDDRERMRAATLAMERTGRLDEEFRIRRADTAEVRWIHSKAALLRQGSGGPVVIGVNHDVTARRQAVEAARERDQRLRLAFAAAGIFAWDWDIATGRVEWSEAGETALGLPRGGFPGTIEAFRALVHPDDLPAVEAALRRALTGEDREYAAEFRMRRADGTWRRAATRGTVLRDGEGRPVRAFGVDHDISARVEAEAALAEAQRRREAALETGGVATWTVDVALEEAEWDARMCALFGLPAHPARLARDEWARRVHPDDRAAIATAYAAALRSRQRFTLEYRVDPAVAGAERWIKVRGEGEHDAATGALLRVRGTAVDVTDHKAAELSARAALEELEAVYASAPVGLCVFDAELRFTRINARLAEINGLPVQAHLGRRLREVLPGLADAAEALHRRVLETGEPALGVEVAGETPGRPGVRRIREEDWLPLHDPRTGRVAAVHVVTREVTEERALRAALAASEARYRATFEQAAVGVAHVALDGRWLRVNRRLCDMLGYAEEELLEGGFQHVTHPSDLDADLANVRRLAAGEASSYAMQKRYLRKDGSSFWAELTVSLLRNGAGAPVHFVSVVQDISERKAAEAALAESEAFARRIGEVAPCILYVHDLETRRNLWASRETFALLGFAASDVTAMPGGRVERLLHPGDRAAYAAHLERLRALPEGGIAELEHRFRRADGSWVWLRSRDMVFRRDAAGRPVQIIGAAQDVSAYRSALAALEESEARFRALVGAMPQIAFEAAADGAVGFVNDRFTAYTGLPPDGATAEGWLAALHPGDRVPALAAWEEAIRGGSSYEAEARIRDRDGTYRWFLLRAEPLRDEAGRILRWFGTATDISDIVAAREAAAGMAAELERRVAERTRALSDAAAELQAEMRRREDAQAALLQSQKLEALGQLTSGVAHDFNNLLAALLGSYRLLERRLDGNDTALEIVRQGRHAAERGARLIAQLLAFARREELHPALTDPGEAVRGAEELICQTAGPELRCAFDLAEGVWPVLVDPVRLETAMLNLVANARDAMPAGGALTVSVRNAAPGEAPAGLPRGREFVRIAVADTGTGMDAATLRRATEPFFTTKPRGKGTGLGLASAHALATGSGGTLRLTSAPGAGTTVELFFPRAAVLASGARAEGGPGAEALDPARHGAATILLVEDDDAVRPITSRLLRELGYAVLEATNAETAEAVAHAGAPDMLVTDVDLGGAPGPVLAARLRKERPGLPVLYLTGHGDAVALDGAPLLRKPFTDAALATAVLQGLGRLPAADGPAAPGTAPDRLGGHLRRPEHQAAYRRWLRLRDAAAGALPMTAGFAPDDLPPDVRDASFLLQVLPTPEAAEAGAAGFRVLHAGRMLELRLGRALAGRTLGAGEAADDPVAAALGGAAAGACRRCVRSRAALYEPAALAPGPGGADRHDTLLLPLSADGMRVTHLLGLVAPAGTPPAAPP